MNSENKKTSDCDSNNLQYEQTTDSTASRYALEDSIDAEAEIAALLEQGKISHRLASALRAVVSANKGKGPDNENKG